MQQGAETTALPQGCSQTLWMLPALGREIARRGTYSPRPTPPRLVLLRTAVV